MNVSEPASVTEGTRTLRVLHVIPHLGPGGSECVLLSLLGKLDRERVQSALAVLSNANVYPAEAFAGIRPAREFCISIQARLSKPRRLRYIRATPCSLRTRVMVIQ